MVAISTFRSMAPAIFVSLLPKTAGSIARIGDDRYAPKEVRKATIIREDVTLAQVAVYAATIERCVKGLKIKAQHMVQNGEKNLFTSAMQKLEKNEPLFLAGLAFTANISAEMISRKLSPRNIWKKPDANAFAVMPNTIQEPIQIEICEIESPRKLRKFGAAEKSSAKTQPSHRQEVPFSSRPPASVVSPAVNPFQVSRPLPPVARPAFSV